jgi:hypothetical protein
MKMDLKDLAVLILLEPMSASLIFRGRLQKQQLDRLIASELIYPMEQCSSSATAVYFDERSTPYLVQISHKGRALVWEVKKSLSIDCTERLFEDAWPHPPEWNVALC